MERSRRVATSSERQAHAIISVLGGTSEGEFLAKADSGVYCRSAIISCQPSCCMDGRLIINYIAT